MFSYSGRIYQIGLVSPSSSLFSFLATSSILDIIFLLLTSPGCAEANWLATDTIPEAPLDAMKLTKLGTRLSGNSADTIGFLTLASLLYSCRSFNLFCIWRICSSISSTFDSSSFLFDSAAFFSSILLRDCATLYIGSSIGGSSDVFFPLPSFSPATEESAFVWLSSLFSSSTTIPASSLAFFSSCSTSFSAAFISCSHLRPTISVGRLRRK
mmetsp:Transcript_23058/g.32286  ORF Transcript_23058/g.32286 Transcript_23058/m.32286 type:complete len:212 (+) Transcript_23058:541-1176(+)